MATREQVIEGIRRANRAGDKNAVQVLGAELMRMDGAQPRKPSYDRLSGDAAKRELANGERVLAQSIANLSPQQQAYAKQKFYADPRIMGLRQATNNPDTRPTSTLRGIGEGLMQPWNKGAELVESGLDAIGLAKPINSLGEMVGLAPGVEASKQQQQQAAAQASTQGSGAGRFVGNVLGTAWIPGGPIAQGAGSGVLLSDEKTLGGMAKDAVIGGASGYAGGAIGAAAGRAISPKVSPVISRLQKRGIPLTLGQIAGASNGTIGKAVKATEDKLTSIPIVGDAINASRRRGVDAFNRAAVDEALQPIGQALPKGIDTGHAAITFAEKRIGAAYDEVLARMSAKADSQFVDDITNLAEQADTMLPERSKQFAAIMNADVRRFFNPDGTIDGKGLKEIESRLGAKIRNYMGSADPDARDMASALRETQSHIRALAARQNPAEAAALSKVNDAYARFTRVQQAAGQGLEGKFTPGQLRTATRVGDRTARKGASARGEALMQQFAEDAQATLPSSIPDSGTAGRMFLGLGAGEGLGSAVGAPGVSTATLLGGAALYSKPGQKAAEWLLTGRQGPAAKAVSKAFGRFVGVAAAPATVAVASQ